jgi:hypothetical protein
LYDRLSRLLLRLLSERSSSYFDLSSSSYESLYLSLLLLRRLLTLVSLSLSS